MRSHVEQRKQPTSYEGLRQKVAGEAARVCRSADAHRRHK
jgi:hypothetical protein